MDKRCGDCTSLTINDDAAGQTLHYKGKLNNVEELHGHSQCELKVRCQGGQGDFTYTGGFKENQFDGKGTLQYADTGNVFHGEFYRGVKHGDATLQLAQRNEMSQMRKEQGAGIWKGKFNLGGCQEKFSDYGFRF